MNDLVMIQWQDSFSMDYWQTRENAINSAKEPMTCRTVGYILNETVDSITVCHTINEEDQVCGVIQIPKRCIVGTNKLNG